jgi:hypothetical protein
MFPRDLAKIRMSSVLRIRSDQELFEEDVHLTYMVLALMGMDTYRLPIPIPLIILLMETTGIPGLIQSRTHNLVPSIKMRTLEVHHQAHITALMFSTRLLDVAPTMSM